MTTLPQASQNIFGGSNPGRFGCPEIPSTNDVDEQLILAHGLEPSPVTPSNFSDVAEICTAAKRLTCGDGDDDDTSLSDAARRVPIIGFDHLRFEYALSHVLKNATFPAPATIGDLLATFENEIVPQQGYFAYHQLPFITAEVDDTTLILHFGLGDG